MLQLISTVYCLPQLITKPCSSSNPNFTSSSNSSPKHTTSYLSDVSIIILDSISSLFWLDKLERSDSTCSFPSNYKGSIGFAQLRIALKQVAEDYRMIIVATKTPVFPPPPTANDQNQSLDIPVQLQHHEFLPSYWSKFVTHRIVLSRVNSRKKSQSNTLDHRDKFIARQGTKIYHFTFGVSNSYLFIFLKF